MAGAAAVLWLARAVRAETEAEYGQGPYAPRPLPPASSPLAASPASRASQVPGSVPRKPAFHGYAAESARTATRLPAEEREARQFLRAAAAHARFEAEAGRLAADRAASPRIRTFAAELLEYRAAADPELLHLLAARGMAMPMMEDAQRKSLNRMARLSGARFDREFAELLGRERRRQEVQQYERAVLGLNDPVLKAWIDRQLPSLRQQEVAAAQLVSWGGRRAEAQPRRPVASGGPAEGRPPQR